MNYFELLPQRVIKKCVVQIFLLLFTLLLLPIIDPVSAAQTWHIVASQSLLKDEAVKVVINDLQKTAQKYGIDVEIVDDDKKLFAPSIVIGNPARNRRTAELVKRGLITLRNVDDEQGYEIVSKTIDGYRIVIVAGGGVLGDVYGLYWIWDRIRVTKKIPQINTVRIPALKTRISLAWGRRGSAGESREEMRHALRYSINWVSGPAVLDLVPWDAEPERSENERNRERTRDLIQYAHSLHMKYFSFANEFTYHPSILKKYSATLSPCDPCFWDALQEKYRLLFQALPELDGVELCTDDISGFWGSYRPFDIMHEEKECEWPLDKRYRTFIKKVYNIVVNEFNKTYFHFTWSLVAYEQHNQPDVFKKIFTNDVPVKDLYLIPKITAADRWWHQPYNPTFNVTPHHTIIGFETMNYYESSKSHIFPTFPGQYFQAGIQTFLMPEDSNVKGSGFLAGSLKDSWGTRDVTAYVLYRLSWNPNENIKDIARDFCSIHFGMQAAEKMAEIYLLSPIAYKYGLHIEPVSYGQFNSFIHMRVGTFPAMGYPSIDGGREHIEFLQKIYLRCKPWQDETILYLDHGLKTAEKMIEKYKATRHFIADTELARTIGERLKMTKLLIQTNNRYVKTAFAYFAYREQPSGATRKVLKESLSELVRTREDFVNAPGFGYRLFGVDLLIACANKALDDLQKAEMALKKAPTRKELEQTILRQQELYRQILNKYADEAIRFMHFEGEVDGRDILSITGNEYKVDHLRWDYAQIRKIRFSDKLPQKAVTVIPKDIESRPMHPFVLEQPSLKNNFTAKIYLYDKPGGYGVVKFDLYYLPRTPKELGLEIPWEE